MLKTNVLFFNLSSEFAKQFCPICQQTSECPMLRTMLAAVHATEERLIAPRYMMQISARLAFFTPNVNCSLHKCTCHHILNASQNESDLHLFFCPQKYNNGTLFVTGRFQWQRRRI